MLSREQGRLNAVMRRLISTPIDLFSKRGVHSTVSLMAHHTARLQRARGNCGDFMGE